MSPTQREVTNTIEHLVVIHDALAQLPSLRPGALVDRLFTELVTVVQLESIDAKQVLHDERIQSRLATFQDFSSRGESALEEEWAQTVISSSSPDVVLRTFPYFPNYQVLIRREMEALTAIGATPRRALFIGGGPLPLSAIILARDYNLVVTCLDSDFEATKVARQVIEQLGLSHCVNCEHQGGEKFTEWLAFDVVWVAALAGSASAEKIALAQSIAKGCLFDTLVLLRGADDLKVLLYPPLPLAARQYLKELVHVPSVVPVINTTTIATARPQTTQVTENQWQAVSTLLTQLSAYRSEFDQLKKQEIGDAMFFADPVVWLLYKSVAYEGSPQALTTLGEMRQHAKDERDICGRRWRYLVSIVAKRLGVNLTDQSQFIDSTPLSDFIDSALFSTICADEAIMEEWQRQEYFRTPDDRVAKWEGAPLV